MDPFTMMVGASAILGFLGNLYSARSANEQMRYNRKMDREAIELDREKMAIDILQSEGNQLTQMAELEYRDQVAEYGIKAAQKAYDAFTEDHGQAYQNVVAYHKTLTARSLSDERKANLDIQMAASLASMQQSLSYRGITPGSGLMLAVENMASISRASQLAEIESTSERMVAEQQMKYLDWAKTQPLSQGKPADWDVKSVGEIEKDIMSELPFSQIQKAIQLQNAVAAGTMTRAEALQRASQGGQQVRQYIDRYGLPTLTGEEQTNLRERGSITASEDTGTEVTTTTGTRAPNIPDSERKSNKREAERREAAKKARENINNYLRGDGDTTRNSEPDTDNEPDIDRSNWA